MPARQPRPDAVAWQSWAAYFVVATVMIERSSPAIRAEFAAYAPADEARFVAELRDALARGR